MKTFIISFLIVFLIPFTAISQTAKIGWHIIERNAEYAVLVPSTLDDARHLENIMMGLGEVVMVFEINGNSCLAYDPMGRILSFKDINKLSKLQPQANTGVGFLTEDILFLNGDKLSKGSYVWVIAQNLANSTIRIKTFDKQELDIPMEKIELFSARFRSHAKNQNYKIVN